MTLKQRLENHIYGSTNKPIIFSTNTDERLRITSTGDLSLRTTTQNAYLGLTANSTAINFTLGSTSGTNPRLYLKGVGNGQSDAGDVFIGSGTGGIVQIRSAELIKFEVNSDNSTTEALRIDSSGRLLAGTTTEGHNNADDLTIATTGHTGITLRSGTSNNGSVFFSDGTSGADEYRGWVQYTHTSNYLTFGTNASEKLRIDSSGRVLIGTSTEGELNADDLTIATTGNTGLTIRSGTTSHGNIYFSDGTSGSAEYRGIINYAHNPDAMTFSTAGGERLRITSGGQVRIANTNLTTSSKADKLIVGTTSGHTGITIFSGTGETGNIYFGDTDTSGVENRMGTITYDHSGNYMRFSTSGNNEKVRITSDGKLLVGRTSGSFALDVESASVNSFRISNSGETSHGSNDARIVAGGTYYQNPTIVGREIKFRTFNTSATEGERVRISADGNVGIGAAAPDTSLHIKDGTLMIHTTTNFHTGSGQNGENYPTIFFKGDHSSGNNPAHGKITVRHSGQNTYSGDILLMPQGYYGGSYGYEEVLRVSAHKRVGINESNPASTLVVRKDSQGGRGGEISIVNYASGGSNGIGNEAALNFGLENSTYHADNGNAQIKAVTTAATNGTDIVISNWSGSNFEERIRIDSDGLIIAGNSGTKYGDMRIQSFVAHGANASSSAFSAVDTTSVGAGVGGEIAFHGKYNTGAQDWAYFGHIKGIKENATAGNTACALTFHTRPNATAPQERLRIASDGNVTITNDLSASILTGQQVRYSSGGANWHGHPRSVVIGYSGSNYASLGMGWVPTSTNDVYTSANTDYQSRLQFYDGLQIYASGVSVTSGQNITWKNVADFKPGGIKFYTEGNNNSQKLTITSGGSIGINATTPSAGDMATGDSQNVPLLHVYGSGSSATGGAYNLLARFEAGGDADGTGAMIALNHSNDRGLAIQGGRRTGNYAHGALKMIDNVGRLSDAMLIHGGAGQGVEYMAFFTGASTTTTERFRIGAAGNFAFNNNGGDNRIVKDTTSGGPYLLFHNRGINTTDNSGVYNLGGISAAGYRDVSNPGIVGSMQFERQPTAGGASSGCDIIFRTGFNGTTSHTAMAERLRINFQGAISSAVTRQAVSYTALATPTYWTHSATGRSDVTIDVSSVFGVPDNAKAILVQGWYHISGYGAGAAGQGDHASSHFAEYNNWSGSAPWSFTTSSVTTWGQYVMDHDGDSSGSPHHYGMWGGQGVVNVNPNGNIYGRLYWGYSGGTHYNQLWCFGYYM